MSSDKVCHHTQEHLHDVHCLSVQQVDERIEVAKKHCAEKGIRFTMLRQQVYELILRSERPLGAYDLIAQLQSLRTAEVSHCKDGESVRKNVAPPTIYRSLEFLLSEGFIHQLTSLNAYVPCCHPRSQHTAAFLICERCHGVQECSSLPIQEMVRYAQDEAGFCVQKSVIELSGLCRACV